MLLINPFQLASGMKSIQVIQVMFEGDFFKKKEVLQCYIVLKNFFGTSSFVFFLKKLSPFFLFFFSLIIHLTKSNEGISLKIVLTTSRLTQ